MQDITTENLVVKLKEKVLAGEEINREQALALAEAPLAELCAAADEIRRFFCADAFDMCTIINAKSGRCSENCKYCAQAGCYDTNVEEYPLLDCEKIVAAAKYCAEQGVLRFSLVTSGKRLADWEVDKACEIIREICQTCDIAVCASFGLLNEEQFARLKAAGLTRVHNNLEAPRRFFPNVCTTHSYDDKIAAIKAAQAANLSVCSGGIMGLGESMEDRIDMALDLRELGVNSVPVNMLNPIAGTPFADNDLLTNDDMRRICAVFRFILPKAAIRLAGGRLLLGDSGRGCFQSGANAAISGDMLTTTGETIASDKEIIAGLGYRRALLDE